MFNQPLNLSKKVTCSFTVSHHQKEEQYAICIGTPLILLQSEQLQNTILHRTSSQSIVFLKFKAGTISIMLPRERKRENTLFFRFCYWGGIDLDGMDIRAVIAAADTLLG
jgi:hypothetical protein